MLTPTTRPTTHCPRSASAFTAAGSELPWALAELVAGPALPRPVLPLHHEEVLLLPAS